MADKTVGKSAPVALVTGASSGIGEAFARKLCGMGYHVVLVARRRDRLDKLATELASAEVLAADLATDSDLHAVEHRITADSNFEFLVNNAGFGIPGSYHVTDVDAQEKMHRLHIIATARLTHAALRGMMERAGGNIINVSSVAGFLQAPSSVTYNASKAWINSFTTGIYMELKSIHSPVRVQALCPGFTRTEFQDTAGVDQTKIAKTLWMSAEDVVDASLGGLERCKLFVIPGWRYRFFVVAMRCLPQFIKHSLAIRYGNSSRNLSSHTQP
jgi:uncharacterized protein